MRTIELTIYDFDELPVDIQRKVVNNFAKINIDHTWYDGEFDYWNEKLEEFGFVKPQIHFCGFYGQGDGACFDCDSIHFELAWKFFKQDMAKLNNWTHRKIQAHETWIYDYLYNYTTFKIQCVNNRYCHENTRSISSYCYRTASGVLDKIYTEFEDWLENFRRGLCDQIYHELCDRYDHLTSDDAIIETIRLNEYEFYPNGKIA